MHLPGKTLGDLVARRETSRAFLEEERGCLQLWDRGCDGEDAASVSSRSPWNGAQSPHIMCGPPETRSGDGHVSICLCLSRISKVRERHRGACICGESAGMSSRSSRSLLAM